MGFYSELDQDQDIPATTDLFPSPSRTDDSDTNWSERTGSRSSSTPVVGDYSSLPTMTSMGIKREVAETEQEVNLILSSSRKRPYKLLTEYSTT